jgi:hypothetical protein
MVKTRDRAVAAGSSSPPSGKRKKGKLSNDISKSAGRPSKECLPIKGTPSPSKTATKATTPPTDGTKCPSLPRQQEECKEREKFHKSPSPSSENLPTPPTDSTKQPSIPRQREECKERFRYHRRIENQILRLRLRRRLEKIRQLSADVVEGYGKYYQNKYGRPLPADVVVKIETLFSNRVERRCAELGLSVSEEKQWTPDAELLEDMYLTDSGEESEEHDSDDVVFDSRSESGDDDEDNQNDG